MRFVINRGQPFQCEFVIKQPGASVPLNLIGFDGTWATGTFTMATIGPNSCITIPATDMTITDETSAQNGIFVLTLTAEQTEDLLGDKGFSEDGYPLIATQTGNLDISHPDEGTIFAEIPKIYVRDIGVTCA